MSTLQWADGQSLQKCVAIPLATAQWVGQTLPSGWQQISATAKILKAENNFARVDTFYLPWRGCQGSADRLCPPERQK